MKPMVRYLAISAALSSGTAMAKAPELALYMPTDTAGNQLFSLNPATFIPKGGAAGYADIFQTTKVSHTRNGDNDVQKINNDSEVETRGIGFVNRVGTGVGLGLFASYERERLYSKNDASNRYRTAPADEFFNKRSIAALFNVEFTQGMRIGISYRQVYIINKVIGSFGIDREDSEGVRGTMSGLTAGGYLGSGAMAFGLTYRLPNRGKARAISEDKITSEPGVILASMHYDFTKEFRFGLSLFKWTHEKDELAAPTTNRERQTLVLKGLSREASLYPTETAMFGFDYAFSSAITLRLAGSYEQNVFTDDPTKTTTDSKRSVNFMRAKTGLQVSAGNVVILVGGDYAGRKYSATENTTKVSHTGTDLNGFGTVSFNF